MREADKIMVGEHWKGVAANYVEVIALRRVFLACFRNFNPSIQ